MSRSHFQCTEHVIPAQHMRGNFRATANCEEEELYLAVKQYVPLDYHSPLPGDVTIIACHAAGFFKELYEPLFDELYEQSEQPHSNFRIRGIWIADVATHGQSGILNEGRLGNDLCYDDHARDLLGMVNTFRKFMPQPIVGFGHSMGGTNIVQLALLHPRLFTSIICMEPVLNKDYDRMNLAPVYWPTEHRDIWASKEEAMAESRKSELMRKWDRRVLEKWEQYGFRELPTLLYPRAPERVTRETAATGSRPVTFTTTIHHGTRSFARPCYPRAGQNLDSFKPTRGEHIAISEAEHKRYRQSVYRPEPVVTFRRLADLRPSCFFIYGEQSISKAATPEGRADKLAVTGTSTEGIGGVAEGAVADVVLGQVGHFAPFEDPAKVAEPFARWMTGEIQEWRARTEAADHAWEQLDVRQKAMVDDDGRWWVREHYTRKPKAPARGVGIAASMGVSSKL